MIDTKNALSRGGYLHDACVVKHTLGWVEELMHNGMTPQNYYQKQWQQHSVASELGPPKLLDIAIPYEEVLDTAR